MKRAWLLFGEAILLAQAPAQKFDSVSFLDSLAKSSYSGCTQKEFNTKERTIQNSQC